GFINAMNLEDVLGKIETDGNNAHVDGPLVRWESATTNLWHLDAGSSGRPHHQLVDSRAERARRAAGFADYAASGAPVTSAQTWNAWVRAFR
ncbi:hypothetical protein, partial [Azospirillum griseum]|uniref:hypothetical protein n=1 Tax=Azospirillum griseum TaxID=2496639 RepID=UPI001AECFB15